ncbi:hypothetical protein OWV82_006668 [Melia azedarach]|uniref:Uncharacterized protein n=1 Tax=Melia azedarach TaxID=155640 RepID=A0ACC1YIM9_MELAZ|nr:hypothetical protein OWV82_006668 [Melia azedarach]
MSEVPTSATASALDSVSTVQEPLVDSSLTFGILPESSALQNSSIQLATSSTEASQALPQSFNYSTSQSYAEIDRMLKEVEALSGVILPAGTTTYLLECFDKLRVAPSKDMIQLFVDGFRFAQTTSLYPELEAAVSSLHDINNQLSNCVEGMNESARNMKDIIDVMKNEIHNTITEKFNILKAEFDAMIAKSTTEGI